jgi:hypothetical protein
MQSGELKRTLGFAHAPDSQYRDAAVFLQEHLDLIKFPLPPYEPVYASRQAGIRGWPEPGFQFNVIGRQCLDWTNVAIACAVNSFDVVRLVSIITEGSASQCNDPIEGGRCDKAVTPHRIEQFFPGNQYCGAGQQLQDDREDLWLQDYFIVIQAESSILRIDLEGSATIPGELHITPPLPCPMSGQASLHQQPDRPFLQTFS